VATRLVGEAHQVCPYSNTTRRALDINPVVV
jgi:organic hydroperoxide reductase OsmC/OhrA